MRSSRLRSPGHISWSGVRPIDTPRLQLHCGIDDCLLHGYEAPRLPRLRTYLNRASRLERVHQLERFPRRLRPPG